MKADVLQAGLMFLALTQILHEGSNQAERNVLGVEELADRHILLISFLLDEEAGAAVVESRVEERDRRDEERACHVAPRHERASGIQANAADGFVLEAGRRRRSACCQRGLSLKTLNFGKTRIE